MVRKAPRFRMLSQYVGSKDAETTEIYFLTGVDNKRKTYTGSMTLKLSDFFRRK